MSQSKTVQGMKARYNRISTANQKLERQLAKANEGDTLYNDVISGSVPFGERPQAIKLMYAIANNEVDYITVSSIDRLGRNLLDVLNTVNYFTNNGVNLMVENLGITSLVDGKPNSTFKLIVSVMANVAEMERETMLERQKEGIAIAKAKGTYKGRVRGSVEDTKDFLAKHKTVIKYLKQGNSIRLTAEAAKVSPATVQKVKKALTDIQTIA
ncbi:recombinase family protein [Leeuwenhoekiella sp. LLG6367-2.1]|uniref:recombinase family protein n=1 Tax=Leeuwenhoekiella sp. LLG6367-2.1 TaxID=3160833 RepID=UPI003864C786